MNGCRQCQHPEEKGIHTCAAPTPRPSECPTAKAVLGHTTCEQCGFVDEVELDTTTYEQADAEYVLRELGKLRIGDESLVTAWERVERLARETLAVKGDSKPEGR